MYRVITRFVDLQDGKHVYNTGDVFPRSGVVVSEERISSLLGTHNKRGVPLITGGPKKATEDTKRQDPDVDPPKKPEAKKRSRKRKEE